MNRKGEHFSPSRTLTLPHAIKLTDRYVGCAPTDSLRHVSIYISYPSLFHQRAGWPAVVLMWTALLIFFSVLSDRQISRTGIFLTVGAFGLHHTIVWLAASVLSGGFAVWWLWLASSIYWPAQTNQLSSHRTVLGRYFFSHRKMLVYFACRCSTEVLFCARWATDHFLSGVDAELINVIITFFHANLLHFFLA